MMAAGSTFDNLGMPTIRPRGSKGEEKPAEEAPAVAEVAPVSLVMGELFASLPRCRS